MKQKLKKYKFGSMQIGGEKFTADFIILPDGTVQTNWRRKSGHRLVPEDLRGLLDTGVTLLVVGTGANGMMSVGAEVFAECRRRRIEVAASPTADAVDQYNRAIDQTGVLACFHLTC